MAWIHRALVGGTGVWWLVEGGVVLLLVKGVPTVAVL